MVSRGSSQSSLYSTSQFYFNVVIIFRIFPNIFCHLIQKMFTINQNKIVIKPTVISGTLFLVIPSSQFSYFRWSVQTGWFCVTVFVYKIITNRFSMKSYSRESIDQSVYQLIITHTHAHTHTKLPPPLSFPALW